MQTKYESEIENLRSQLKGSQSEQFVKQQTENKKLIEHNKLAARYIYFNLFLIECLTNQRGRVIEIPPDSRTTESARPV